MKISGFSFVRNGIKLYYPIVEAIESILPICNEFVVAVGKGDADDNTREQIEAINSEKVKIIDTVWEEKHWKRGSINAIQTDIAKNACSGDWLFYLQADEVVHEKYLAKIEARCMDLLDDERVEGMIFDYVHFWGDYIHYQGGHGWYPYEIRIIRNLPEIHSWESAQSFRYFEDYKDTHQREGTRKLRVAHSGASIYHYGWVRPPHLMQNKSKALNSVHWGKSKAEEYYRKAPKEFDYGPLDYLSEFKGSHPRVMQKRIQKMDWQDKLQMSGKPNKFRKLHKHETAKYRFISLVEDVFNSGRQIGYFKNYELLKDV